MTRKLRLFAGLASLAVLVIPVVRAAAQEQVPPAPPSSEQVAEFVSLPSDIDCILSSSQVWIEGGGTKVGGTIDNVTCSISGGPTRILPLKSKEINDGLISTVSFGQLKVKPTGPAHFAVAIHPDKVQALREFLGGPSASTQPSTQAQAPSAPTPGTPPSFPKPDPSNFTATSPSKETVNSFLQESWGYDDTRVWQVQAIMKTSLDGYSKVVVYIGDKTGKQKPSALQFIVLPDGKHIIAADDILPFGEHPYAGMRAELQEKANGPYKGAASKDLELVEFADFQCPHCKEAQANMEKLATDFPKARIVFQNYPLEKIHPEAKRAASYGVCVAKQGGNAAFFQYASAVFEGQDGLNNADGATLTLNSAVTKAGLDIAKVSACASTPATDQEVEASVKLAEDVNVAQTPVLMVNGRQIPVSAVPYETLKQIVLYQAKLDGITVQ